MEKEKYSIELKDLIPIKGIKTYIKRVRKNYDMYETGPKIDRRGVALVVYNSLLLTGSLMGLAKGLEKLLQ